jgi:hypothetical protein
LSNAKTLDTVCVVRYNVFRTNHQGETMPQPTQAPQCPLCWAPLREGHEHWRSEEPYSQRYGPTHYPVNCSEADVAAWLQAIGRAYPPGPTDWLCGRPDEPLPR